MKMRKLALALAGVAAVGALASSTAPAMAATAGVESSASAAAVSGDYYFTGEYFYYKSDCQAVGQARVNLGWIAAYACLNGSPLPGDDYELWVRN